MRRGFTLIELLVSIALAMALTAGAFTMFGQVRALVRRTQARLQLHASAKAIYESLRRDLSALQHSCAFWLRSPGGGGATELVFMTALVDEEGFRLAGKDNAGDGAIEDAVDLVWTRWTWTGAADHRLLCARNAAKRRFLRAQSGDPAPVHPGSGAAYPILGYYKWGTTYNPQPRRFTAGDDPAGLDDNAWAFAGDAGGNRGDWSDLDRQQMPVHDRVTACTIEVVLGGDGSGAAPQVHTADGVAALAFCARGVRLDGLTEQALGAGPRDEIAGRPALLRIALTLADRATGVSQDFSFSFTLPGPQRGL